MNHIQRQLIKEAYQEGYYQALYEKSIKDRIGGFFGKKIGGFLAKLFKGKKVDDVGTGEILNKIDDASKKLDQVDDLDGSVPDTLELMKDIYGIGPGKEFDMTKIDANVFKAIDSERMNRLRDYADNLGIDIDDLTPEQLEDLFGDFDDLP